MTTKDKNVEIALMLGKNFQNIVAQNGYHYPSNSELKFDTDANWQFEAINFIRNLKWNISISNEQVAIFDDFYKFSAQGKIFLTEELNIELSIFEALYQFSQYLKTIK